MPFSSITFIFGFMPLFLAVYHLIPEKYKNIVLLIGSVFFYAWGEPIYVVLMILSIVFNFFCGRDIEEKADEPRRAKKSLIFAVVVNVLILCFFKYYVFLMENINALFQIEIPYRVLALPIGISFYTFQAISYLADIYMGKIFAQKNFVKFGVYMAMFPKVIMGPIVRYEEIEHQLTKRVVTWNRFGHGVMHFVCGLAKKVVLADHIGIVYDQVAALQPGTFSALTAWVGCIAFAFQIYFEFSGYSDMAVGLAKMVGFDLEKNFHYPYISRSVTEFWKRWHISLSSWFRDYIYIPLGGNRCGVQRQMINLAIVWILTGCWHGAQWNFIAWGLYYGLILILEKNVYGEWLEDAIPAVRHAFTLVIVLIGWVFFFSPDMGYAFEYIAAMLVFGATAVADAQSLFLIGTNWILLILCFIGSTALGLNLLHIVTNTYKNRNIRKIVTCVVYIGIFLISIAFLVSGEAREFIYFRF